MLPLIDADILAYECGFGSETGWKGWPDPPPFERARELLENRVEFICNSVGATSSPLLFLTGKNNFREKIATVVPYKGKRLGEKPYHYNNIRAYVQGIHGAEIIHGMEADDAMAIYQSKHPSQDTIICSRDKDLRQVPGWVFSWELGKQPSFGPDYCEGYGWIQYQNKKLIGRNDKWFLAQCLMGDSVDNIPGIPRYGSSKAFKILEDTSSYKEGLDVVIEAYKGFYGETWEEMLLEMGQLLWMVRDTTAEGLPKLWKLN